jgi:hypothetical protein
MHYGAQAKLSSINNVRRVNTHMKKHRMRRWIRNWLMNFDSQPERESVLSVEPAGLQSEGMKFQLYRAAGGYVIETTTYDRHKDRRNTKMHIVTDDQDLGDQLGKIVTMEALRA